jgi:D-3-phosphoglycerate dehydrogenase
MIGQAQVRSMRPGSFLVNASRGKVVDVEALAAAVRDGHLLGAAVDVFPEEPAGAAQEFLSPLRGLPNVILTPHIGGSTAEAQARIGHEVGRKLIDYSDVGSTFGAVNFPQVQLPTRPSGTRFMHVHRNTPGLLAAVLDGFVRRGLNIGAQYLQTDGELGYAVIDVDGGGGEAQELLADLRGIPGTVRARYLYERVGETA